MSRGQRCDKWAGAEIYHQYSCWSCLSGVYLVFEVFQETWHSNKENPSVCWHATLSYPLLASNYAHLYLVPISFCSRSDLVLDADHSLNFLGTQESVRNCWLALQTCISFCSVSDKSGALLFLPCSHKNAVAQMLTPIAGRYGFDRTKSISCDGSVTFSGELPLISEASCGLAIRVSSCGGVCNPPLF